MAEIDYVVPELKITEKSPFDLQELYHLLLDWASVQNYDFVEKGHEHEETEEGSSLMIKWILERKQDDYSEFCIEIKISGSGIKEVIKGKHKLFQGKITIKFESYIRKDYEERWEAKPFAKVIRGIYDKFVLGAHFAKYEKKLKDETYDIYEHTKSYLGLEKFQK